MLPELLVQLDLLVQPVRLVQPDLLDQPDLPDLLLVLTNKLFLTMPA